MAFQFTVRDARQSLELRQVAAVCADSNEFLSVLNQVQRRLLRRGDWENTEWLVRLCVHSGCITWPRWIAGLRAVRMQGGLSADIKNKWFEVLGPQVGMGGYPFGPGMNPWGWQASAPVFGQQNSAPCYNDITAPLGRLVRYYVAKRNDIGKKIQIFGKAYGGEPLQEKDADGHWVNGITLTAAAPFVSTSVSVTQITSIVREATEGPARLYSYDPDTDLLEDLALYEPNETNPRYQRSRINGAGCLPGCVDADGIKQTSLEVLAKISFQTLASENDFLVLDNFDALKLGFQALRAEEANDEVLAEVKWQKAIKELNFDIRNTTPDRQTTVRVNSMLGCGIQNPI